MPTITELPGCIRICTRPRNSSKVLCYSGRHFAIIAPAVIIRKPTWHSPYAWQHNRALFALCYRFRANIVVKHSNGVWANTSYTFYKKLKNASCEFNRLNGWNSTLQAAWYIRRVRITCFLWTKPTIWLLILRFTQNIVRACCMLYPYEGYRSVTPLGAFRVNRTIFP